jgi:hypothetical protein
MNGGEIEGEKQPEKERKLMPPMDGLRKATGGPQQVQKVGYSMQVPGRVSGYQICKWKKKGPVLLSLVAKPGIGPVKLRFNLIFGCSILVAVELSDGAGGGGTAGHPPPFNG